MCWTKYDFYTRQELKKEIIKRKLGVYLNSSKLKFRQALTEDDLKKGIDPYLKIEFVTPVYNDIA